MSDAIACGTCIISGNCDARSRALRSITFWTPHAVQVMCSLRLRRHALLRIDGKTPEAPTKPSGVEVDAANDDLGKGLRIRDVKPLFALGK